MTKKLKIGLICGGTSGEHEVSLVSAYNIQAALDRDKYDVLLIGIDKSGTWFLGETPEFLENVEDVRQVKFKHNLPARLPQSGISAGKKLAVTEKSGNELADVDVFFPITHGKLGEDGALQGLLELLGIPYVGADVYGSAICMDKDVTKRLLQHHGIPVSRYKLLRNPDELSFEDAVRELGNILFVKPCREGSSLGVSKVRTVAEYQLALQLAFAADRKVLVEEAISGREIECSVLGNDSPEAASVLGEIAPRREFYSYEAKYVDDDGAELIIPAEIESKVSLQIRKAAVEAFQVTECRSMARVDFFLCEDNTFILNEINTLPGFTKISMYPKLWEASGLAYSELLDRLIQLAQE
ncbi:MAG: D-alanine--D-alanine ligase [SAR324 cluster bacterium]|nr:D-alanine--D-alanine ligase [SAR324 cluster bacterium]MBL7034431.1 D-alanine--D-alanine ligase [SAR324 cluster bacterium]